MPPSRRSSSSHSSRSHHRSSSHRSSRRSSSRHSYSSHSSRSHSRSSYSHSSSLGYVARKRINQPTHAPRQIKKRAVCMYCRNHDYVYYDTAWRDEKTGAIYQKGYYDETGKYYDADDIAFKRSDGSYMAHYICNYCGAESESTWQEGIYPICKNCGAQMEKQPVFIDDIIDIEKLSQRRKNGQNTFSKVFPGLIFSVVFIMLLFGLILPLFYVKVTGDYESYESSYNDDNEVTNLDIYGDRIYLMDVGNHTYEICDQDEAYDKYLEWDYGADSYYDTESNCYLWYNTDVAPNLWQYWYDDIAGDSDYGWMECENGTWYIEISDTEWTEYTGDTSNLWHIKNRFDE